jgi:hypothetical protein
MLGSARRPHHILPRDTAPGLGTGARPGGRGRPEPPAGSDLNVTLPSAHTDRKQRASRRHSHARHGEALPVPELRRRQNPADREVLSRQLLERVAQLNARPRRGW